MRRSLYQQALVVAGSLAAFLVACSEQPGEGQASSPTIATVGGSPISQALFEAFVWEETGTSISNTDAGRRDSLLIELKRLKAAALAGEKNMDADLELQLELQRLQLLAQRAAAEAGAYKLPTDDELEQAYDRFVASLPGREYRAAHILVATEGLAGVLITRLQAGEAFGKLAATHSADDSKVRSGEVGWIAPGKLPAAFTDALGSLEIGAFTAKPVHTAYGWHIIRLLDTRPVAAPPMADVRAQLAAELERERYARFLDESLRTALSNR